MQTTVVVNIETVRAVYALADYYFQHGLDLLGQYYSIMALEMSEDLSPFERCAIEAEMRPSEPSERCVMRRSW
jgi:hypothetical protein